MDEMGGRPATTGTAAHRARMRRYRAKLEAQGVPEADDLDKALIRELRGLASDIAHGHAQEPEAAGRTLKAVAEGAIGRLTSLGFDRKATRVRMIRRLAPRSRQTRVTP